MYPHERSLVKNYKDRPFALIGVNCHDELKVVRKAVKDENITWRSFFDGKKAPIARSWNVSSFPTIFLLDHEGRIRYRDLRGPEMDAALEKLVKEAEAAKKKAAR